MSCTDDTCKGKKHPCPDCTFCQWCSDDRCTLCLKKGCQKKKLSLEEQIALYDAVNNAGGGDDTKKGGA